MKSDLARTCVVALLVLPGLAGCQDEQQQEEVPPVAIAVSHIKFDHMGPDADVLDGLNIRASYRDDLQHAGNGAGDGEWIAGSRNEPALYVVNTVVTIRARLTAPPNITSADIHAVADGGFRSIPVRDVRFVNGVSRPEYVEFNVEGRNPSKIRKDVHDWQWKAENVEVQGTVVAPGPFNITRSGPHTTYTVLAPPSDPWYRVDSLHPWASALEFAITTAGTNGNSTTRIAATRITTFLHSGYGLAYSGADEGGPKYYVRPVVQQLDLTGFMVKSAGNLVACEDLAAAVVALTNVVGGKARFVDRRKPNTSYSFGYLNTAVLVGNDRTNNPFHAAPGWDPTNVVNVDALALDGNGDGKKDRSAFSYHTFALMDDNVYDATLGPALGVPLPTYVASVIDRSTQAERDATAGALNVPYQIWLR